jgi:hypothetical protein
MESAEIERELRGLAERVRAIEDRLGLRESAGELHSPGRIDDRSAGWQPALPNVGGALVGVAAAYVLRALVDSGALPARVGVGAGILYAIAWLVAAGRRADALYAVTSALVLAPLLWEATLRLHVLTPAEAAVTLLVFTLLGLAISWRKNLMIVATAATIAGLATAMALLVATRAVVPFTMAFLAIAAAIEVSACLEHWLGERWLAAAAADAAVLLATWLVTNPRGLPSTYEPISHGWLAGAQVALLGIYLASTIVRTMFRHFQVTAFEVAQCAAAFGIAMWGGLPVAGAMVAAGVACYVVSFVVLERGGGRNFYTYSTFGLLLTLAASRAVLAGPYAMAAWAALAIGCSWSRRVTLQVHGAIYLGLALTVAPPLVAAIAAGLCYAGAAGGPLRIPMFAGAVWKVAVLAATFAPANLQLAVKLSICGAALILLPRIKAGRTGLPVDGDGVAVKEGAAGVHLTLQEPSVGPPSGGNRDVDVMNADHPGGQHAKRTTSP